MAMRPPKRLGLRHICKSQFPENSSTSTSTQKHDCRPTSSLALLLRSPISEMDSPDGLCAECVRIDPVGALEHGGPRLLGDNFVLQSGGHCKFCNLCTSAFNSASTAAGQPSLEHSFKVRVSLRERWKYLAAETPDCYVNWLEISIVRDAPAAPSDELPVILPSDTIHIQIIRNTGGAVSDSSSYLYGRRVYNEVDLRLVKFWMSECADKHDSDCRIMPIPLGLPEYLIDTSALMLVPKEVGSCQYAALSYCWGDTSVPQLKLKDLKDLAPNLNSWPLEDRWTEVPQTIKDAILLCRLLSIPYLWVDALCILHDRPTESGLCDTHLAGQMQSIYEAAHLTIVAAAGRDSWAGLPGVRPGTRSVGQHTAQIHGAVLANELGSPHRVIGSSTWNTRAWTFQESILSTRLLIFTEVQCYWTCNFPGATFCEDIHRERVPATLHPWTNFAGPHLEFRHIKQDLSAGLKDPNLNRQCLYAAFPQILQDYTSRALTYPQDALEAFSGIASFLSRTIDTRFFWGLPLRFFEQALLFRRNPDSQRPLVRRNPFPSWSWVGWHFGRDRDDWITCDIRVGSRARWWQLQDFPPIKWYRFTRAIDGNLMLFEALEGAGNSMEDLSQRGPKFRTAVLQSSVQASNVLLFDAMAIHLDALCHNPSDEMNDGSESVSFYLPGNQPIGTVGLGTGWNSNHAFYLVAIAQETKIVQETWLGEQQSEISQAIHTLLVETDTKGVSERRYKVKLDKSDWDAAEPQQHTFILV